MSRPRLLDLFCGAGGCSVGYERAGFDVVGVDANPKLERYYRGGTFVCADALEYVRQHGHEFDAIHASPPCQAHSVTRSLNKGRVYPELIPATRAALQATGRPYVIENVPGAPLGDGGPITLLCGSMFGLATPDGAAELRRHRLFECGGWWPGPAPECRHGEWTIDRCARTIMVHVKTAGSSQQRASHRRRAISVTGSTPQTNVVHNTIRETFSADDARYAMGIGWMPMRLLSQAIPPAQTEWLGRRLLAHIIDGRP